MPQILLVRHAQSANNALPEEQRVPDPGLTERGYKQATETARVLANRNVQSLYCSPFLRSLETARQIASQCSLRPIVRSDLFEQGGCYSGYRAGEERGEPGLGHAALASLYPGWDLDPRIPDSGWWGREYETLDQAQLRAAAVRQWLEQEICSRTNPIDGDHVFVIHADFKRLLIYELIGARMAELLDPILGPLHNTGISSFRFDRGRWMINSLNATSHLPIELVT